jgi:hypothetical protein
MTIRVYLRRFTSNRRTQRVYASGPLLSCKVYKHDLLSLYGYSNKEVSRDMVCTAKMFSEDEEDLLCILKSKPRRSEWLDVEEDWLAMDDEF